MMVSGGGQDAVDGLMNLLKVVLDPTQTQQVLSEIQAKKDALNASTAAFAQKQSEFDADCAAKNKEMDDKKAALDQLEQATMARVNAALSDVAQKQNDNARVMAALDSRSDELDHRKTALNAREDALDKREAALSARESSLISSQNSLQADMDAFAKRTTAQTANLNSRESFVSTREAALKADTADFEKRRAALDQVLAAQSAALASLK